MLGDASPFVFELGHHDDWNQIVWACCFGEDCINFTGSGQGGAIAAVFDIALCGTASSTVAVIDPKEPFSISPTFLLRTMLLRHMVALSLPV